MSPPQLSSLTILCICKIRYSVVASVLCLMEWMFMVNKAKPNVDMVSDASGSWAIHIWRGVVPAEVVRN